MNESGAKAPIAVLTVRWIARVWSIASVGFVLLIVVGELAYPHAPPPSAFRDLVGLFFFPFGTCVGMILAWRWEGVGGRRDRRQPAGILCAVACDGWAVSAWPILCTRSSARSPFLAVVGDRRCEEEGRCLARNDILTQSSSSLTLDRQIQVTVQHQ
jgi:hypothetical protein